MSRFHEELYDAVLYGLNSTLSRYDPASALLLAREMGHCVREYLEAQGFVVPRAPDVDTSVRHILQFFVDQQEVLSGELLADGVLHTRARHVHGLTPFVKLRQDGGSLGTSPLHLLLLDELERFQMVLEVVRVEYDVADNVIEAWLCCRPGAQPSRPDSDGVRNAHIRRLARPLHHLDASHVIAVERERARELEDLTVQMAHLHQVKAEIIAGVSHELKTPLHCILGYTELLAEGGLSPRAQHDYLDIIHFNGRQLLRLVEDVLDWSRLEVGQLELQLNEVPVLTLLERTVRSLQPLAQDKSVRLNVMVKPADLTVVGDPSRLLQVTTNLVVNAIKFSASGGEVTVRAGRQEPEADWPVDYRPAGASVLRLDVIDQGLGIAPEDQDRIFESFQQVRGPDGKSPGGSGLGLSIARRIVELHGGRLWVQSRLQEGSTFSMLLPH